MNNPTTTNTTNTQRAQLETPLSYGANHGAKPQLPVTGNKPLAKFKAGAVVATIWANSVKGATGEVQYHSITLDRRYMDKNGAWQTANSLRVNDLPKAALALQKAYEHLILSDPADAAINPAAATYLPMNEEEVLIV